MPALHFAVLDFSKPLASELLRKGYEMYAKTDLRFIDVLYRVCSCVASNQAFIAHKALRDEFNFVPKLTKEQFFTSGFAEQKILLCVTVINLCVKKHEELTRGKGSKHVDRVTGRLASSSDFSHVQRQPRSSCLAS